MRPIRIRHRDLVVACDLPSARVADRLGAWEALRTRFGGHAEVLDGGARLWLQVAAAADAEALVRAEAACCGFLDIVVVLSGGRLRIDLTSPLAEGATVARALAGLGED